MIRGDTIEESQTEYEKQCIIECACVDCRFTVHTDCSSECACVADRKSFDPVCGSDNMTYFSACFAGCTQLVNGVEKIIRFDYNRRATYVQCMLECGQDRIYAVWSPGLDTFMAHSPLFHLSSYIVPYLR